MKNKEFFTEILTKPIRYTILIASLLSILALLLAPSFLPSELPYVISLVEFLNKYSGFIFIIFFASFFLLIIQSIPDLYKKYKEKSFLKFMTKMKKELYEDELAWDILLKLYYANGDAVLLVASNQKVKLLAQYSMIVKTNNFTAVSAYSMHKAEYPYVLQPETEKYIRGVLKKQKQE